MTEGLFAPTHLIVLAFVVLLLFGPRRLPEIGRSLGTAVRGFRDGVTGNDDHANRAVVEPPPTPTGSAQD